jgi:hypothetical protein
MSKLANLVEQLREDQSFRSHVERAEKRFQYKPFAVRFSLLRSAAIAGKFTLPVVSIATGAAFLAFALSAVVPVFWIACLLSVVLLCVWEVGKSVLIRNSFEGYYSGMKLSFGLFAGCLIFASGSAFMSVEGAKELHKGLDTSVSHLEDAHGFKLDSLLTHYETEKKALEDDLEGYKRSVSWRGKIDIHNATTKQVIASFDSRINRLEEERSSALNRLRKDQEGQLQETKERAGFSLLAVAIIAGVVDLLIFASGWFVVFFDYQVLREREAVASGSNYELSRPDLENLIHYIQLHEAPVSLPAAEKQNIGFALRRQETHVGKHEESHVVSGRSYTALVEDIQNGVRDYRELARRHKVNMATIKKYMDRYSPVRS